MNTIKFKSAFATSLILLQFLSSYAYAGFLYLPFSKFYSPTGYVGGGHTGTDYRGDGYGTPVYAAFDGTIVAIKETENDGCDITRAQQLQWGNYVKIDHQVGSTKYRTEYWHLKQNGVVVNVGDKVRTGDLIAYVSNSGDTRGSDCAIRSDLPLGAYHHLHFEVKQWNGTGWIIINPYGADGWLWATNVPTAATSAPPPPCTGWAVGAGSSRQQLFIDSYNRNGGQAGLGCSYNHTDWHRINGHWVVKQDFSRTDGFHASIVDDEGGSASQAYVIFGWARDFYLNYGGFPSLGVSVSDEFTNSFGHRQQNFSRGFIWRDAGRSQTNTFFYDNAWHWLNKGGDSTLNASFALAEGGGVQMILDGQGGSGPWVRSAWVGKDIPDVSVTPDLRVVWEQFDRAHMLFFGLVILGADGTDRFLSYSYDGDYWTWKQFASNVFEDFNATYGIDPVSIKELRVGHYLYDPWVGDVGGTVRNIVFDYAPPQTSLTMSPAEPDGQDGWYTTSPLVTLSATDDASGVDYIEYNLGSGWRTYSSPFLIDQEGEAVLQYRAVDRAGKVEPTKSEIIKIDTGLPQTKISTSGPYYESEDGKAYVSPQTKFELSATDAISGVEETKFDVNKGSEESGGAQNYQEPFSLDGEDGGYTVEYGSNDVAGNVEPTNSQEVYLDSTAPVSTDDSDGQWRNEDVIVTVAADDGDGSGVQKIVYSGSQEGEAEDVRTQLTYTEEGIYELAYFAIDNVENAEGLKQSAPIKIDKTPPEIFGAPTEEPNENNWYNENVIVHFEAEDQTNLSGLREATSDVIVSTEGANQEVSGTAEDNAGNTANTVVSGINIDKTPPESMLNPLEPYYNTLPMNLNHDSLDNLSSVDRVRLYKSYQGGNWEYHNGSSREPDRPFVVGTLREGRWEFSSCAVDRADNEECDVHTVESVNGAQASIIYDINPPTSEVGSLTEGAYYNASTWPGIFGTADDANPIDPSIETSGVAGVEVRVDTNGWEGEWVGTEGTDKWSVGNFAFEDGFYVVSSRADDHAGNQEHTLRVSFVYDATPPITYPHPSGAYGLNGWYVSPVELTLSVAEANPFETYYVVNGSDRQVYTDRLAFSDGIYEVKFWSVDRAGNEEEYQLLAFKIDTVVPAAPSASTTGGTFFIGDKTAVALSAGDDPRIYYFLDGEAPVLYTGFLVIGGNTTISAYVADEAGNLSETISWSFTFIPKPLPTEGAYAFEAVSDGQQESGEVRGAAVAEVDGPKSGNNYFEIILIGGALFAILVFLRRIFLLR